MAKSKEEIKVTLELDFSNPKQVSEAISNYKYCPEVFIGTNQNGESVEICFYSDATAQLTTYQDNGWVRVNYYSEDGCCECETFERKWRE